MRVAISLLVLLAVVVAVSGLLDAEKVLKREARRAARLNRGAPPSPGLFCPETDDYGYSCAEIEFDWEEVATGWTNIPLEDDDAEVIPIGFDFEFYGTTYSSIYVGSNGALFLEDPETDDGFCCDGIAMPYDPANVGLSEIPILAAYWTDLDPDDGGTIQYALLGELGARRLTIQYDGVPLYNTDSPQQFAVVLHENSNHIDLHFQNLTGLTEATDDVAVGLQSANGSVGLTAWFAEQPDFLEAQWLPSPFPALAPFAIRFEHPPMPQYCPLNFAQMPQPESLSFCTQYNSSACCSTMSDMTLQTNAELKLQPLYGEGNCYTNIRNLFCSWTCGPFQAEVMKVEGFDILNITLFVESALATSFYESCEDVCLPMGGGATVEQLFGNPVAFLSQFDSANDPSYVPDATHPNIFYSIGLSPNGGNIDSSMITILPGDAQGCPTQTTEATSSTSSTAQVSSSSGLAVAFSTLLAAATALLI